MTAPKAATVVVRTDELIELLRARYTAAPGAVTEWAFFEQVRANAGAGAERTADAVAMNLWESRGLAVHGFEVKVSRSDWQREIRQPEKAEPLIQRVDFWWLVVGDPAIVRDGELPEGWGLMVPRGGKLVATVQPTKREGARIDRGFVASLLRRVDRDAMASRHLRDAVNAARESARSENRQLREELDRAKRKLDAVAKAAGAGWGSAIPQSYDSVETWAEFGRRVGQSLEAPAAADRAREELQRFAGQLEQQAARIRALVAPQEGGESCT